MLREGVYGQLTPRQALPADRIASSATHLRHLVDRLLDIAKIAAGRVEIHAEPLILRPFVLNVASEMESLVSERGLALSIGVAPSIPRIRTDQTHLRQILINLIGNAVKYTPSGTIQVRARLVGNGAAPPSPEEADQHVGNPPDANRLWVALQVSDTGVGIAPADLERIFDEFEQVNAGARTDSARRGTGLGLAISRRLARLLGGELTVASEVGRGSVFTVWLPLEPAEKG
jgi:signal transduction histidine kinase